MNYYDTIKYSKTSLSRPAMEPTLNCPLRDVVGIESEFIVMDNAIVWDTNKAIDIWEWSICGGGELETFYCTKNYQMV